MPSAKILIIGAAQAGLATAFHLKRMGLQCTLLDTHARVGDAWRTRWDSLSLFSPARYSMLPDRPYPGDAMHLPTKDEVADYQESFAAHHQFEIHLRHKVEALDPDRDGYALTVRDLNQDTTTTWKAQTVVVATGPFATPYIPKFQSQPAETIHQFHAANYKRPTDLPQGPVLVVGTGASGAQIAAELSATHKVYLSGPETPNMPRRFLGKDFYWWLYNTGLARLKVDSWLGRKLLRTNQGADALIGKSLKQITAEHGLLRRGLLIDFQNGLPKFEDTQSSKTPKTQPSNAPEGNPSTIHQSANDIQSIVWATGYHNDYTWIHLPIFDPNGQPIQHRGAAKDAPNLYFIGLKFLYKAHSANLGGVPEDAQFIASQIAKSPQSPPITQITPIT